MQKNKNIVMESHSGWMERVPLTAEQKSEWKEYTEMMRQRYLAAGCQMSL